MTQIQLYEPNSIPDGWHNVTAPGGYEWWYFDAEDRLHDRQIVVILLHGFVFHPGYLRAYDAFVRRPTAHAPPIPGDFPCAYFVVYERGRIAHQFMLRYNAADFHAEREKLSVAIGANHAIADGGKIHLKLRGSPWKLTWQGPRYLEHQTLTAEFTFTPRLAHAPIERTFLSQRMTGATHRWVIANPLCDVEGVIRLFDAVSPGHADDMRLAGLGYHDHNYGTAPIGPGLRRWFWGRALFDDGVYTFHYAVPADPRLPPERHLIEATARSATELDITHTQVEWRGRSGTGLAYPTVAAFDDTLRLSDPRVIDSAPFYLRLIYHAHCRGRRGTAFCEVAYPHRLRWPVLGRMIEMSITRA